jgi:CRP-like cAMP-binding protein
MPGPTTNEKRKIFEGQSLFAKLPEHDLDALLSHARVERYAAGARIFSKGTPGRSMMAILHGSVRISTPYGNGRELVLARLHSGEVFGEIALLDGQERTADVTAIDDCELLVLDQRDVIPFLERRGDLCILLLRVLCQRLRQTNQQIEDTVFERLDSRIAKALLRLARAAPDGHEAAASASIRVSQRELADLVGTTRESINKQLQAWQRTGVIELGKRLINIPDIDAIEALI